MRDNKLDFLRAIAIILVIAIHTVTRFSSSSNEIVFGNWLSQLFRPCVAIFFFISGFLFTTNNFKEKLKRILFPYFFFSVFAIIYTYRTNIFLNLKSIFLNLISGNSFGIYYFVIAIIIMYLISFLLKDFARKNIVILFILSLFINLTYTIFAKNFDSFITYRAPFIWAAYFFFGVLYKEKSLEQISKKYTISLVWGVVVLICSYLYLIKSIEFNFYSPIGTIYAFSTILFLMTFDFKHCYITSLSKISYTIYLSHIFFVYTLYNILPHSYISTIPIFIGSFLGSIAVYNIGKLLFKRHSKLIIGA